MDKKAYMTPEVEAFEMKVQGMLCISGEGETPSGGSEIPGDGPDE